MLRRSRIGRLQKFGGGEQNGLGQTDKFLQLMSPRCGRGGVMSKNSFSWLAVLLLAASVSFVLPSRGQNRGQDQVQLPEGNGQATVQAACGVCHSMNQVTNSGHDREEWTTVLHMMVNVGAPVPDNQFDTVGDYLAKNFPPKPQPPAQIIPGYVDV